MSLKKRLNGEAIEADNVEGGGREMDNHPRGRQCVERGQTVGGKLPFESSSAGKGHPYREKDGGSGLGRRGQRWNKKRLTVFHQRKKQLKQQPDTENRQRGDDRVRLSRCPAKADSLFFHPAGEGISSVSCFSRMISSYYCP